MMLLSQYRTEYTARPPDLATQRYDDEMRSFSVADGVAELLPPPAEPFEAGIPPRARGNGIAKYLWVVTPSAVPYVLEEGTSGKLTKRGYAAHTNLTGGDDAHVGGELWFRDANSFYLNGKSGRYGPRSKTELEAVVMAFAAGGYSVASFGWDMDRNKPHAFLRGDATWTTM
jgi:hypothetical protein